MGLCLVFSLWGKVCYSNEPSYLTCSIPWVQETLKQMTLRQKIAQLFMIRVGLTSSPEELHDALQLLQKHEVGGVFVATTAKLEQTATEELRQSKCTIAQQIALLNTLQQHSTLPLLVGADYEWGLAMRLVDGTQFPFAMALGNGDPSLTYQIGHCIGREARAVGVHAVAAPVLDVNSDPRNPVIGVRSFGEQADQVAAHGKAMMCGLQDAGCIAVGKHFTGHQDGHGNTSVDSHAWLPVVQDTQVEIARSFQEAIDAGIGMMMTGHVDVRTLTRSERQPHGTLSATMSQHIITTLLQGAMHFRGIVMTDALDMGAIVAHYGAVDANIAALRAGNQLLVMAQEIPATIERIEQLVQEGTIARELIDKAVCKILQCKAALGLHIQRFVVPLTAQDSFFESGRSLAKRAYRHALKTHQLIPSYAANAQFVVVYAGITAPEVLQQALQHLGASCRLLQWAPGMDCQVQSNEHLLSVLLLPARGTISPEQQELIAQLGEFAKVHQAPLLLFGNPYARQYLATTQPCIVAYDVHPWAQQAVAHYLLREVSSQIN